MVRTFSRVFFFALSSAFLLSLFVNSAFAASPVPTNLSDVDRVKALEVLGFGSASKLLSSPYPLGGYSGVEVSVSSEYIPLSDVATLGSKNSSRGDLNYFTVAIGKGLFYNIDFFVQFIPMPQEESLSGFAAQLRWAFYEANFMPAVLSVVAHTSSVNFANVLGAETTGFDLVGSVNMKDVSLFVGAGHARSLGSFVGGTNGITSSGRSESAGVNSMHTIFGVSINMSQVFIAMEVDRYVQSTYGGRVGWRF